MSGEEVFLEVREGQYHSKVPATLVRLQPGKVVERELPRLRPRELNEAAADYLASVLDFKCDPDTGLLTPALAEGQSVIVDRAGQGEIKVLDPAKQSIDVIEKRELVVKDERRCTCPIRDMFVKGFVCCCGARK